MSSSKKRSRAKKPPIGLYVAAAVVVVGLIAFITTGLDGDDADSNNGTTAQQIADVSITGSDLPTAVEAGADPAVGLIMPEVTGQSFDGTPVAILNDGQAKAIIFLSHW